MLMKIDDGIEPQQASRQPSEVFHLTGVNFFFFGVGEIGAGAVNTTDICHLNFFKMYEFL